MFKDDILRHIETVVIIIVILVVSLSVGKAQKSNGRLEMCKELDMVYTANNECITQQEYINLNNIKIDNVPNLNLNFKNE